MIGIDFSHKFIETAKKIQQHGEIEYEMCISRHIYETKQTQLSHTIDRSQVSFEVGDACALSHELGKPNWKESKETCHRFGYLMRDSRSIRFDFCIKSIVSITTTAEILAGFAQISQ